MDCLLDYVLLPISFLKGILSSRNSWRKQTNNIKLGEREDIEYATFRAANMVLFDKINKPQFSMILIGAIISIVVLGIGVGINHLKSQVEIKK